MRVCDLEEFWSDEDVPHPEGAVVDAIRVEEGHARDYLVENGVEISFTVEAASFDTLFEFGCEVSQNVIEYEEALIDARTEAFFLPRDEV